ncbi:MAG: OmpA family protein [Aliarcobacter sp.]|nr:OmpA family protein [Aliarcobacter sp.]
MSLKKVLGLSIFCVAIGLNASMTSAILGNSASSSNYEENKERGIISDQDIDGDGIIDSEDDCLTTNPCTGKGCEKPKPKPIIIPDTDGDGILDNLDQCPDTPKGFEINSVGCSELVNLDVQFDTGKWKIKDEFTEKIDLFVDFMKKHKNYNAIIEGHTDSVGTEQNNQILSENRATSVKNYLIEKGVEESRLKTEAYGESRPLNDNITKEDKQANRRVVAVLEK